MLRIYIHPHTIDSMHIIVAADSVVEYILLSLSVSLSLSKHLLTISGNTNADILIITDLDGGCVKM